MSGSVGEALPFASFLEHHLVVYKVAVAAVPEPVKSS